MARGVLMHRLLQSLPDIPPQARTEAARRHLARAAAGFTAEEREAMLEQVRRVLDDPRFSELFLPGSRAEVPIVGRSRMGARRRFRPGRPPRGHRRCGADRRLQDESPRAAGASRRRTPAYVAPACALPRRARQLYPDKTVRAALIWTDVPDLMEISAAALDRALAAVTSP